MLRLFGLPSGGLVRPPLMQALVAAYGYFMCSSEIDAAAIAANSAIVSAVVAGCVAFVVGIFTVYYANRRNRENIYASSVIQERAKWRDEMREHVSNFIKLSHQLIILEIPFVSPELRSTKSQIALRLNPSLDDKHKIDQTLLRSLGFSLKYLADSDINRLSEMLILIEQGTQLLIKQEWEKSKDEAGYHKKLEENFKSESEVKLAIESITAKVTNLENAA